jgi:hypothetical protein
LYNYIVPICVFNILCLFDQLILVDLKDAKEVRCGRNSKEFDRWPDELKKFEATKCFVIFYGNEFKLKTLSVVGMFINDIFMNFEVNYM